jgi:hypothetical protein
MNDLQSTQLSPGANVGQDVALVPVEPARTVADSLAALRQIARHAKDRHDPALRWATAEEIALAESQRRPHHCAGSSARTGLPCRRPRVLGTSVCPKHGGSSGHVKRAAARRLRAMVDPVLERLYTLSMQDGHRPSAVNAARDLLDRAGIGELVTSKVRGSQPGGAKVVVNIGFLG